MSRYDADAVPAIGDLSQGNGAAVALEISGVLELSFKELAAKIRDARRASFPRPSAPAPAFEAVVLAPHGEPPAHAHLALRLPGAAGKPFTICGRMAEPALDRVAEHLRRMLAAACDHPGASIGSIDFLPADEQEALLRTLAGEGVQAPPATALHDLFFERARQAPGRRALVAPDRVMTYGALAEAARRVTLELRNRGVGTGDLVGICGGRSSHTVAAILGCLNAGAAYVPLDPAYPPRRLHTMIEDAGCSLLLTDDAGRRALAGSATPAICITSCTDASRPVDVLPPAALDEHSLAYVIFTSGSTGRPKGVAVTHGSAGRLVQWARGMFSDAELAVVLAGTSFCFDISVFEIFVPLAVGGTVRLAESVLSLPDLPDGQEITLVNTVPSALNALLRLGPLPRSVRTVNLAGEPLPGALARELHASGIRRALNLYGPTEDTVYSTFCEVPQPLEGEPDIGRPLPGTTVFVLDRDRRLVPLGVPGELYLGGAGLAQGYIGRPDLTAERFVWHNLRPDMARRLYRTGDRVRMRPNGTLEYLGRLDDQVKLNGFRIELGEVTSCLREAPGVTEAIALTRTVTIAGESATVLVGYYAAPAERPAPEIEAELRAACERRLPRHMRPGLLVRIERLPLTPNGKLDKRRLPEPAAAGVAAQQSGDGPAADPAEAVIAAWRELAGHAPLTPEETLFDAGVNSIGIVRFVARLRSLTGRAVSLGEVLRAPSAGAISDFLRSSNALPGLASPADPARLSAPRRQIWMAAAMADDPSAYTLAVDVEAKEASVDQFVRAFRCVAARHPALRSRIILDGDEPRAVEVNAAAIPIDAADAGALDVAGRWRDAFVAEQVARAFDLEQDPPMRVSVAALPGNVARALVIVHHVAFDDWSLDLLVEDLEHALAGRDLGTAPRPPVPPAADADFVARLGRLLAAAARRPPYCRDLAALPARPRRGQRLELPLAPELVAAVQDLARRHRTSEVAVMMTAFLQDLGEESGLSSFPVGVALAGRAGEAEEREISCFVNTLPVIAAGVTGCSFSTAVERVSAALFDVLAHQTSALEQVVRAARTAGSDLSGNPFVVAFGAHNAQRPREGGHVAAAFLPTRTARLDLTLWIESRGEQRVAAWTYATDIFTAAGVQARHERWIRRLRAAATSAAGVADSPVPAASRKASGSPFAAGRDAKKFAGRKSLVPRSPETIASVETNWLGGPLPALVRAQAPGLSLRSWIERNRSRALELLETAGGILFRGFACSDARQFSEAVSALAPEAIAYSERSSPRHQVDGRVYTSTDHPNDQPIFLHNEQSYTLDWPLHISFFCEVPPAAGGRTPLADNRRVIARLPDPLLSRFDAVGVLYVRNYLPGISLSWQEAFQTSDRAAVEAFCAERGIGLSWMGDDGLRTWQRRSAFQVHPLTGERLWFNHAMFFHATSLAPVVRDALLAVIDEASFPYNTYYGDGAPIEAATLQTIRAAVDAETVSFPWQLSDVLVLDNMVAQHGREPYSPPRRILTLMASPISEIMRRRERATESRKENEVLT